MEMSIGMTGADRATIENVDGNINLNAPMIMTWNVIENDTNTRIP